MRKNRGCGLVLFNDLCDAVNLFVKVVKLLSVSVDGSSHALQFCSIDHGAHTSDNGVIEESGVAGCTHSSSATGVMDPPAAAISSRKWWVTRGSVEVRGSISLTELISIERRLALCLEPIME